MKSLKTQTFCTNFTKLIKVSLLSVIAIAIIWHLWALLVEVIESHDSLLIQKATNITTNETNEQKQERFGRYETNYRQYVAKIVLYSSLHIVTYAVISVSTYKNESMASIFVGSVLFIGILLAKQLYFSRIHEIIINGLILLLILVLYFCDAKLKRMIGQRGSTTNQRKQTMQMKNIVVV